MYFWEALWVKMLNFYINTIPEVANIIINII